MQNSKSTGDLSNSFLSKLDMEHECRLRQSTSPSNLTDIVNQIFDENDPQIKHDTVRIILQYLSSHGYTTSAVVLQEESGMVHKENSNHYSALHNLSTKVTEGDWEGVELLLKDNCDKEHLPLFLYFVHKQVYLEYISRNEYQKAHHYLFKHIKPMEGLCEQYFPGEFKELCYLLSVKSITSSHYFQHWPGVMKSREMLYKTLSYEFQDSSIILEKPIPDDRLTTLFKQACCFQAISSCLFQNTDTPTLDTLSQPFCYETPSLLEDYENHPIPSLQKECVSCSGKGIKSTLVIDKQAIISAGEKIVMLDSQSNITEIGHHDATIWNMTLTCDKSYLISGGSDHVVRIASLVDKTTLPIALYTNHNDIYAVASHPYIPHYIANANFDGSIQIWNFNQQKLSKEYQPHTSSVTSISFNPAGNLLFSGGKDCKMEIWDVLSLCQVSSFSRDLKEITGLDVSSCGNLVAVASRSNCHSLVDTRTNAIEMRFRGVMNMRSNFLRVHFLGDNVLYSGSENGDVCIWDIRTQQIRTRLKAPCGFGCSIDCMYCKETGSLFAGYNNGDVVIWGS